MHILFQLPASFTNMIMIKVDPEYNYFTIFSVNYSSRISNHIYNISDISYIVIFYHQRVSSVDQTLKIYQLSLKYFY